MVFRKKKRHTIKTQIIIDIVTKVIICIAFASGKTHDFKIYTESIGSAVLDEILMLADSGYQGILNLHQNSKIPKKKPKNGELTDEEKAENTKLSKERIFVENMIAKIKVFKIVSNRYRNSRRRFALRMSLVCGIINYESTHHVQKAIC